MQCESLSNFQCITAANTTCEHYVLEAIEQLRCATAAHPPLPLALTWCLLGALDRKRVHDVLLVNGGNNVICSCHNATQPRHAAAAVAIQHIQLHIDRGAQGTWAEAGVS